MSKIINLVTIIYGRIAVLVTDPTYTSERRKLAFTLYTGTKDKIHYRGGERWRVRLLLWGGRLILRGVLVVTWMDEA